MEPSEPDTTTPTRDPAGSPIGPTRWRSVTAIALATLLGAATGAALRSAPAAADCGELSWDLTLETVTAPPGLDPEQLTWPERMYLGASGGAQGRRAAPPDLVYTIDCDGYL